ncbi:MAG: glycosyltransferase, partial [Bacteroidetes bacterium]
GYQKDLRPFWKNASVFIVPLWYGSGIRIKILEALANGIPVVSTEKGAEGLPDKIKKKIIIVNTSQEFQMAIRKVAF